MEAILTRENVAGLLNELINKLRWVEKTTYGKIYGEGEIGVYGIWTGHLMTLSVDAVDGEPGHFIIRWYYTTIVKAAFRTDGDVKACFDEYILPILIHAYYSSVSSMLIKNVTSELNKCGKYIFKRVTESGVAGSEIEKTLDFASFSIRFSYERKQASRVFEYYFNGFKGRYNPVSLSQAVENINKDLVDKTKQYIESLN